MDVSGLEYELYFNFCLKMHADEVIISRFRWRDAATLDDIAPGSLDYVSLHSYRQSQAIDYERLTRTVFPDREDGSPLPPGAQKPA